MPSSIASGASRCFGRQLNTQSTNVAALDRYSAIRNFFKQQNLAPSPASITSRRLTRYNYSAPWFLHSSGDVRAFPSRPSSFLMSVRTFATTPYRLENPPDAKNKSSKPPEDLKTDIPEEVAGAGPHLPPARDHENYSRFFQRLALSLPHLHRPTREDFLNVATNFWQRLRIRFKWFTVRGFRKFNADDISAFITWFLMSQTLWILVGTYVAHIRRLFPFEV